MTHLDEGTIHAWLDGALDDARASEVSKHAATCKDCGALVAEARGLIAGTSRILTALDDVPAVAPKRAPAVATAKPAARMWQAAPWVTGIAAALILAVGLKTWLDKPDAKASFAEKRVAMDSLVATTQVAPVPMDTAPRLRPISAPPSRGDVAPTRPRARAPQTLAVRGQTSELASSAGAGGAGVAGAAVAAPAPPPAAVSQPDAARKEATADMMRPEAFTRRADAPAQQLAGCYRIDPAVSAKALSEAPAAKAATAARDARSRLAPTSAAPSAAAVAGPVIPAIVRLDTATTSLPRSVVSVETGERLGVWVPASGDSVRVVSQSVGTLVLSSTNRVACPNK